MIQYYTLVINSAFLEQFVLKNVGHSVAFVMYYISCMVYAHWESSVKHTVFTCEDEENIGVTLNKVCLLKTTVIVNLL